MSVIGVKVKLFGTGESVEMVAVGTGVRVDLDLGLGVGLMPSCETFQTQLLSFHICQPVVDRHLEKSCRCAAGWLSFVQRSHPLGLGATLVS